MPRCASAGAMLWRAAERRTCQNAEARAKLPICGQGLPVPGLRGLAAGRRHRAVLWPGRSCRGRVPDVLRSRHSSIARDHSTMLRHWVRSAVVSLMFASFFALLMAIAVVVPIVMLAVMPEFSRAFAGNGKHAAALAQRTMKFMPRCRGGQAADLRGSIGYSGVVARRTESDNHAHCFRRRLPRSPDSVPRVH